MRPFLFLGTRPEDEAADAEYEAVLAFTGLRESALRRIRVEAGPIPPLDPGAFSGIILGGGPFTTSDPEDGKSATQRRAERELSALLDEVVERDIPFLGACYGIGTLGVHQGGIVDRRYGEPVGAVQIELTEEGRRDPLLAGVPEVFEAFVGHKEACRVLPPGAVLLARSAGCPVQMFRLRRNLYATQFHPELTLPGIRTRIRIYREHGYFPPEETDRLLERVATASVPHPGRILTAFVERYARYEGPQ